MSKDIVGTKDSYEYVSEAYSKYGTHVNVERAIPSFSDGFKPIQRKLIYSYMESGKKNETTTSASIVGYTMANFHPHGDESIYQSLVAMVNDTVSPFTPQGNFGYSGLTETGAAASRYTAVLLNESGLKLFGSHLEFIDQHINDMDRKEYDRLNSIVPYAILNGADGIGVGTTTSIPAFDIKSIIKFIDYYFKGWTLPDLIPAYQLVENEESMKQLNEKGFASFKTYVDVDYNEKDGCIIVKNFNKFIRPTAVSYELRVELPMLKIFELKDKGDIVLKIEKQPRVRGIDLKEIADRLKNKLTKTVSFRMVVTDGGTAFVTNPKDWLKHCVDNYKSVLLASIQHDIDLLEQDILYNKIKHDLADLLLKKTSDDNIIEWFANYKGIKITNEQLSKYAKKPISSLRSDTVPEEKLKEQIDKLKDNIKNINSIIITTLKDNLC